MLILQMFAIAGYTLRCLFASSQAEGRGSESRLALWFATSFPVLRTHARSKTNTSLASAPSTFTVGSSESAAPSPAESSCPLMRALPRAM